MSQAGGKPSLLVAAIATFLFTGHSKVAPGTMGSLGRAAAGLGSSGAGPLAMATGLVVVTWLGTWAAGRYCEATGRHTITSASSSTRWPASWSLSGQCRAALATWPSASCCFACSTSGSLVRCASSIVGWGRFGVARPTIWPPGFSPPSAYG